MLGNDTGTSITVTVAHESRARRAHAERERQLHLYARRRLHRLGRLLLHDHRQLRSHRDRDRDVRRAPARRARCDDDTTTSPSERRSSRPRRACSPTTPERASPSPRTRIQRTARSPRTPTAASRTRPPWLLRPDSYTYTITDRFGRTSTATVTITVVEPEPPPPDPPNKLITPPPDPPNQLPLTGGASIFPPAELAAELIALGTLLGLATRRRNERSHDRNLAGSPMRTVEPS